MTPLRVALFVFVLAASGAAAAQDVSGHTFEDRNGNGIFDPGEPPLAGVQVRLFGNGGAFDQTVAGGTDGSYAFSPNDGCYLLLAADPSGWRFSGNRSDGFPETEPGYEFPVGRPRFSKLDRAIGHLLAGNLDYAAMGDSIAWNFNFCSYPESFWYSKQVQSRMNCAAPPLPPPDLPVTLVDDGVAVKGDDTDDLLVDDTDDNNNVFRMMEIQPELITISMIGNDLLGVDPGSNPTPEETNTALAELLDARQNLQEAISVLTSEIPDADIALNTLYDNEAYGCPVPATSDFHREWLPIVRRMLRDLAWGQARRASVIEAAAEFARENLQGSCEGFTGMICRDLFGFDNIHPENDGYTILREKLWEAAGGVSLGSGDALGRSSIAGADYGYLRRVRRLLPTAWEVRDGATADSPEAALDDQDGGAAASVTLGIGSEEFRVSGFPDWFDEIRIVRVIAGVRYRTSGTVGDDFYRMEASVTDQFRPPAGFDYTTTNWNWYSPIVGGGGPNQPPENPDFGSAKLLAVPDVPAYREASTTLTKNPVLTPGSADYEWPALTHEDLATTTIRVAAAPVAATPGNDPYRVELDYAWLDLYGWEEPRPGEVQGVRLDLLPDGTLEVSFDPLAGAQRYNLYFGRLSTLRGGGYDHGTGPPAGPFCDAGTEDAGGGRLRIVVAPADQPADDAYALVTAHVDDVESPSGHRSDATEIDRSQSVCR